MVKLAQGKKLGEERAGTIVQSLCSVLSAITCDSNGLPSIHSTVVCYRNHSMWPGLGWQCCTVDTEVKDVITIAAWLLRAYKQESNK